MDNKTSIDWTFISNKEGGTKTLAYVPVCTARSVVNVSNRTCFGKPVGSVIGKSGVTIGAGVDLGQMNLADLQKLNLPAHLYNQLKDFVGKKKNDALEALDDYRKKNNRDLQITGIDAEIVNQRVKERMLGILVNNYNRHSTTKYQDLPPAAQTALASFSFQYGPNINSSKNIFVQNVWNGYLKKDYPELIKTLNNAPEYQSRRKEEAALLANL